MDETIGPILYARGGDSRFCCLSALLAAPADFTPPRLEREGGGPVAPSLLAALDIGAAKVWRLWRYDFALPVRSDGAGYALGLRDWRVRTDFGGDLRLAYTSCNGMEADDLWHPRPERNVMWKRLADAHAAQPLSLLMQGGDQLYADAVWECHPELARWNDRPRDVRLTEGLSHDARQAVQRFYASGYLKLWSQPELAPLLAEVPSLMMWDDHDIFDGWGSHDDERQAAPVWRAVFHAARRAFALFQLGARPDQLPAMCPGPASRTLSWSARFGDLHVIAPDLRSERTPCQALGTHGWAALDAALDAVGEGERVLLMSSVPALGPRLSWVERLMHLIPGAQRYEDDLRDQWQSRAHRAEWQALLRRFCDLAERGAEVTVLSGEIHLATRGVITRGHGAGAPTLFHQLVASGIAHPPPPRAYARALGGLAWLGEDPLPDRPVRLKPLPGRRGIYTAERNYLLLERREGRWMAFWETEDGGVTPTLSLDREA